MNKTDTDSGKQPEDDFYPGKQYQNLFNYISKELGKSLLQSEMQEIISIVHKDFPPSGEQGVQDECINFMNWFINSEYYCNAAGNFFKDSDTVNISYSTIELYKKYLLIKK